MIARRSGLIANISDWAGQKYLGNLIYGVSRTATGRLARDMAHELLTRTCCKNRARCWWSPPWRSSMASAISAASSLARWRWKMHERRRLFFCL